MNNVIVWADSKNEVHVYRNGTLRGYENVTPASFNRLVRALTTLVLAKSGIITRTYSHGFQYSGYEYSVKGEMSWATRK